MVTLGPGDRLRSGVPLGGIGAGKVEIDNRGKMVNLTITNNWSKPLYSMRGFHVMIRPDDAEPFFLEYGLPIKQFYMREPDSMTYTGRYPFAEIQARKGGVTAKLEVFSPIIPGNLDDSSIPAFGMSVKVDGSGSGSVTVAASNLVGSNTSIGRMNEGIAGGVRFVNHRSNNYDGAKGEHCLIAANPSKTYTQYNMNISPGLATAEKVWKYTYESEQPWLSIIEGKPFEGDNKHEVFGQWDDPAGAVTTAYSEGAEARYAFSWYFVTPSVDYAYGHYYQNRFGGAEEAGRYVLREFDRLRRESRAWHDTMVKKDLPEWLRDAIINSTYVLSSSSWLDERGRFAMHEATKNDRQLGSITGLLYEAGALPVIKMFPDLDRKFLEMSAGNQREDGYIPHDFGILSLDHPTGCTTSPPGRKDIGSTFILMNYRHSLWTHDPQYLARMYPKMLKAFEWDMRQDRDGDGLPDLEGEADTSYDAFPHAGRDSFVSSLFIASLTAMRESSRQLGKTEDTARFDALLTRARQSFLRLYNGRYFRAWSGEPSCEGYVFMGQLAGHWWTSMLGLEPVTEKEKIDSSFDQLFNVNAKASRFCTPNMVHESGRIWDVSCQAWSSMPRFVFALSAVRYRAGDKKWLEVAKKEWNNLIALGCPWDQPSRVDGRTGKPDPDETYFLDHYLGSPALWTFTLLPE